MGRSRLPARGASASDGGVDASFCDEFARVSLRGPWERLVGEERPLTIESAFCVEISNSLHRGRCGRRCAGSSVASEWVSFQGAFDRQERGRNFRVTSWSHGRTSADLDHERHARKDESAASCPW